MPFVFDLQQQPAATHMIHLPAAWEFCENILKDLYMGNEEVAKNYEAFSLSVKEALADGSISGKDTARIIRAIQFSAEKHKDQTRKNEARSPYIIHPIGVADHLMRIGNVRDANVLIAALLHDTVEDTSTTFEEIRREFGEVVEGYVREVTDDRSLPKVERKRLQIENAPHKSPGAAMIKIADKYYNLTDLSREIPQGWTQERVDGYFAWAKEVVDALPSPVNSALKQAFDLLVQDRAN